MECFKCGAPESKTLLFDAISSKGVVKICRKCSFKEDLPIIKKPSMKAQKRPTVQERLSKFAGLSPRGNKVSKEREEKAKKEDESLKRFIEKKAVEDIQHSAKMENLIDNFHWIIMRARRAKKLTQEQFANEIGEPASFIRYAERGIIPAGKDNLVRKIESYLGIIITKREDNRGAFYKKPEDPKTEILRKYGKEDLKFDSETSKMMTLSDLKELQQRKEAFKSKIKPAENSQEDETNKDAKGTKGRGLSQEDINKIIYGK